MILYGELRHSDQQLQMKYWNSVSEYRSQHRGKNTKGAKVFRAISVISSRMGVVAQQRVACDGV